MLLCRELILLADLSAKRGAYLSAITAWNVPKDLIHAQGQADGQFVAWLRSDYRRLRSYLDARPTKTFGNPLGPGPPFALAPSIAGPVYTATLRNLRASYLFLFGRRAQCGGHLTIRLGVNSLAMVEQPVGRRSFCGLSAEYAGSPRQNRRSLHCRMRLSRRGRVLMTGQDNGSLGVPGLRYATASVRSGGDLAYSFRPRAQKLRTFSVISRIATIVLIHLNAQFLVPALTRP